MLDPQALLGFLALGAAGSVHCMGMCGGFALSVAAAAGPGRKRALGHALLFGVGKALTYVILGLVLSLGVAALTESGADAGFAPARTIAAWIAGLVLILFGASWAGLLPRRVEGRLPRGATHFLTRASSAMRALGGPAGAFGAGVVTGFLPCGLSWAALALATQVDPLTGALGLFAFGLATTPALAAFALGWGLLTPATRARAQRLLGLGIVGFGVATVLRGG